ncbi:MAG: hypothetical protein RI949_278 [Pseudomonadota bacterium]
MKLAAPALENLYRQAQVFLDASRSGAPLRVNAQGDLKASGLARRIVEAAHRRVLPIPQRQVLQQQRNREVVAALKQALHEAWPPQRARVGAPVGHLVALLDAAYEDGQLPAARAFVDALGQALQPPTLISASSSALIQV